VHDVQVFQRHVHANRLNGVDNKWLTPEEAKEFCPPLSISKSARYPVMVMMRLLGAMRVKRLKWVFILFNSAK